MAEDDPNGSAGVRERMVATDPGLTRVLDVTPVGDAPSCRFRGAAVAAVSARMFGGHAMAQAVLAAGQTVRDDRLPSSVHSVMMRPGDASAENELVVEVVRDGRAFSTRRVDVLQAGRVLAQVSTQWHADEECSLVADDAVSLPPRPGPQRLPYPAPGVATDAFDLRWTDDGPGRALWFRPRVALTPDPVVHTALAIYLSDLWLADTAVRRVGHRFDDASVRAGTLEHGVWLHRPVVLSGWCCLRSVTAASRHGRAVVTADLCAENGDRLASVVQAVSLRERPTRTTSPVQPRSEP